MAHHRRVYVVTRDDEVRRLLTQYVGAIGAEAWPFAGGADFLKILEHLEPACVLLDMDAADVPGIAVLGEMVARGIDWPVIAISAREELQLVVETIRLGALDFLSLPLEREVLALALAPAWQALEQALRTQQAPHAARARLGRLTPRERDVLQALLGGASNKMVANAFGLSVRTVEMHRAHIMAKLGAKSLAEAALLAKQAGMELVPWERPAPRPRGPVPAVGGNTGADAHGQASLLARHA